MKSAFTLIELLVVVTIIVVLLALLTPAIDKAIYSAELAACGANLKGLGTGATTYALDHRRAYPYRPMTHDPNWWHGMPIVLRQAPGPSLHETTRPYIPADMYLDPLAGKIDLDSLLPSTHIQGNYAIWFGYGYHQNSSMDRLGARLGFDGRRYDVLASDFDYILTTQPYVGGSHPDAKGVMSFVAFDFAAAGLAPAQTPAVPTPQGNDLNWSGSRWESGANWRRGTIEMSWARTDGSVSRLDAVGLNELDDGSAVDDPRVDKVPATPGGAGNVTVQYYNLINR
jgi:prepilin-type N-terminal cleavage/methylation domain-containing protein